MPIRVNAARLVDTLECVTSVLLAIGLAHAIGAKNVSWAAYAGYMVMRGHLADTLSRGALRIAGTVLGGLAAWLATPLLAGDWPLAALVLMGVGTVSIYGAIAARRAYGWLFFGLTFALVLFDTIEQPRLALASLVTTRILETLAGTLACACVSVVSGATLRRRWPAVRAAVLPVTGWHPDALRHAAQGGLTLAMLAPLAGWWHVPALSQAAISVMAVMLVPVAAIGPSGLPPVTIRVLQRFTGCIAGAAVAAGVLLVAHGAPLVLIVGTVIGVCVGRQLENGPRQAFRYVGMQFTLAILTALVPDSYASAALAPALERLSGILVGLTVLAPVLIAWHLASPARAHADPETAPDELGHI